MRCWPPGSPCTASARPPSLFAGAGFSETHPGADNPQAIASIDRLVGGLEGGAVFANLIDTDQPYGHRKDVEGFARGADGTSTRRSGAGCGAWGRKIC